MPKIENNNLLHGVSGKPGNNVVYRQTARGVVMANKPKKQESPTEEQIAIRNPILVRRGLFHPFYVLSIPKELNV